MILRGRAGQYTMIGSYRCFDPAPLPPNPPLELTEKLVVALSSADTALARLDGATHQLPDPELFVYAFMRQEAVLSSQIEGTQASLEDVLGFEAQPDAVDKTDDITEVINYLNAIKWGLEQLDQLPVAGRLLKGIHMRLLAEGRGSEKSPGEFRNSQNWIGQPGRPIEEAIFVPPAIPLMHDAFAKWEMFINSEYTLPPLIKFALAHAQFETIHPFWDGNGRLGRMIITLLLCKEKILARPTLYLSLYFKQRREEYYQLLQATRDQGDWESWVLFFLRGVEVTSKAALNTAFAIARLKETFLNDAQAHMSSKKAPLLAEKLFSRPYLNVSMAASILATSYPTASSIVEQFVDAGYLVQINLRSRSKTYGFKPYLDILHEGAGDLNGIISGEDHLAVNEG
ncbi:MAG: Fic family protein [Sphingomonadales bacterium]